jgi:hypothetical protein
VKQSWWSKLWNNLYHGLGGVHYALAQSFGGLPLDSNETIVKPWNSNGDDGRGDLNYTLAIIVGDLLMGSNEIVSI